MQAEVLQGKQSWVGAIDGDVELEGWDAQAVTIRIPTEHGDMLIKLSQSEELTAQQAADYIRRRLKALEQERAE